MPQHKILILLRDRHTQDVIAERLKAEGFVPLICSPGDAVPEIVRARRVAVALIAERVGGQDGRRIARELRQSTGAGIILVGDGDEEVDAALALEMGADDYVTRPVRLRELCARIRTVLRRTLVTPVGARGARPLPDHILRQVGDMEICGVLRIVRVRGREVDLTTLEFDVLMALAANANAVLSRERIIASVHGRAWSVNARAVDGIVSRLRRKLFGSEEGARRIRTVQGRGYMLRE